MKTQRRKGHNFERKITRELKEYFPAAVTSRNGARGSDQAGIDVINTGLFNTQCKRRENLNIFNVLNKEMPKDHNINVVFWKKDRQADIICMEKTDFYDLLQMLKKHVLVHFC